MNESVFGRNMPSSTCRRITLFVLFAPMAVLVLGIKMQICDDFVERWCSAGAPTELKEILLHEDQFLTIRIRSGYGPR